MDKYLNIQRYYEKCLEIHGDSHLGVDWPDMSELKTRFDVMLGIKRNPEPATILDFGCGTGLLYSHLISTGLNENEYIGLDISDKFVDLCREKHPQGKFYCVDVNRESLFFDFDYAVCNGTFTEKIDLTFDEMFEFFSETTITLFNRAQKGIAFNVMSNHLSYMHDRFFHVPHDMMANFITTKLSKYYTIRNDYGLDDYTVYVYKEKDGTS